MANPFANDAIQAPLLHIPAREANFQAALQLKLKRDNTRKLKNNPNLSDEEVDKIIYMLEHPVEPALIGPSKPKLRTRAQQEQLNKQHEETVKESKIRNNGLRQFGYSNLSDRQAEQNPKLVSKLSRDAAADVAAKGISMAALIPGMQWLRGVSAPLYYGTNAALTAASAYDWYKNGPNFWNITGTIGGGTDLFLPAAIKGYRNFQFGKALNQGIRDAQFDDIPYNVGWGVRLTIPVTHKSDSALPLSLYNEKRWDVVNEDANPLGIWYQGKFGVPRSTKTGATAIKAEKALKARRLFEQRPYTHSGDLTLDKPLVTIGEVPNRSALSYLAEQMGADGIIYNNVYDNGYDANLVILSFKQPDNYMLTARAYKGGPRKSSSYEFFTTDPRYAYLYGLVKPYYIQSRFPIVTEEPLMGSKDPVAMDIFINRVSNGNRVDAIIGHDKVTGEFPYTSLGDEIMIINPSLARLVDESLTLSPAEKAGIPKGDRNFRTHGHDYSDPTNYGKLYLGKSVKPESNLFGRFIDEGSEALVFEDPNNPNMVLKVNTDWNRSLLEFFEKYILKRNRVPYLKPIILRGITEEGFPVFNLLKIVPMTDELYILNLPKIKEMLYQKGFLGDLETGYISDGDITIGDFNPGNVGFDSKGNIVFIDIDSYKKGGKLIPEPKFLEL